VAEEIRGALKVLVEILNSAQEQLPRVAFEVSVVCSDCTPPPDQSKDDPGTWVPAPDPAHLLNLIIFSILQIEADAGGHAVCETRILPARFLGDTRNWWPHS
jgi:hypothetical protein